MIRKLFTKGIAIRLSKVEQVNVKKLLFEFILIRFNFFLKTSQFHLIFLELVQFALELLTVNMCLNVRTFSNYRFIC